MSGDIIRKVGHEHVPVKRPSQVKKLVDEARKANRKTIIVLVERDGGRRFVPIKIDRKTDQGKTGQGKTGQGKIDQGKIDQG